MKVFMFILGLSAILQVVSCSVPTGAQVKDPIAIKSMLEERRFVFQAQTALPSRGASRNLSMGYDLRVSKDTLIAELPYFGRAYSAPMDMQGGGIRFVSNDFSYAIDDSKKSRWVIRLEPKDHKDVRTMTLSVSDNGYASLQVISNNRDPITFNGIVVDRGRIR